MDLCRVVLGPKDWQCLEAILDAPARRHAGLERLMRTVPVWEA